MLTDNCLSRSARAQDITKDSECSQITVCRGQLERRILPETVNAHR